MTHVIIQKAAETQYRWWFKYLYQPGLMLMVKTMPGFEQDTDAYELWKSRASVQPDLSLQVSATGRFPTAKASLYGVKVFLNNEHGEMWPETRFDSFLLKFALQYHDRVVSKRQGHNTLQMDLIATYRYKNDGEQLANSE